MADRVSASIEIGGTLTSPANLELAEIIADEGLSIEWDGECFEPAHRTPGEPLRLFAHEVPWGRFDSLEAWCVAHAIPFSRWSGAYGGEWGAERVVFTGAGEPTSYAADEDDHVVIHRQTIERLDSFDAVIAHFDAADAQVPPLIVDGDRSAPP